MNSFFFYRLKRSNWKLIHLSLKIAEKPSLAWFLSLVKACYEKGGWGRHIDSFFHTIFFFEPYASKDARTVPKG